MMEGRGHLDQRLKKTFLRLRQREPHKLPMLVSLEEISSVIAGEAFGERSAGPVKVHALSIGDGRRRSR